MALSSIVFGLPDEIFFPPESSLPSSCHGRDHHMIHLRELGLVRVFLYSGWRASELISILRTFMALFSIVFRLPAKFRRITTWFISATLVLFAFFSPLGRRVSDTSNPSPCPGPSWPFSFLCEESPADQSQRPGSCSRSYRITYVRTGGLHRHPLSRNRFRQAL